MRLGVNVGRICGFFRLWGGRENRVSRIENRGVFVQNVHLGLIIEGRASGALVPADSLRLCVQADIAHRGEHGCLDKGGEMSRSILVLHTAIIPLTWIMVV